MIAPGLVNRKTKPPVADDCVALALFVKDRKGVFPEQVLKSSESTKKKPNTQSDIATTNTESIETSNKVQSDSDLDPKSGKEGDHSNIQKMFERFFLSKQYSDSRENPNQCKPVSVSVLREASTSTCDLVHLVSSATQTVESSFDEVTEVEPDICITAVTVWEGTMSRERTVMQRDNVSDFDRLKECEASLDALDKRCSRAEKKMDVFEHEHAKGMSVLRCNQSLLKDELCDIKKRIESKGTDNPAKKSVDAAATTSKSRVSAKGAAKSRTAEPIDSSWDASKSSSMVLTQDSQGDPVMTRATPVHAIMNEEPVRRQTRGNRSLREFFPTRSEGADNSRKLVPTVKESATICSGKIDQGNGGGASCTRCDNIAMSSAKVYRTPNPNIDGESAHGRHPDAGMNTQGVTRNGIEGYTNESSSEEELDVDQKRRKVDNVSKSPELASPCSTSEDGDEECDKNIDNDGRYDNRDSDTPVREKYAKVVTRDGWSTPQKKGNTKLPKVNRKSLPMIAGVIDDDTKEYLVNGLSVKNFKTHRGLEEAVTVYCEERKISTTYHRVITFKNNKKTVRCKITVKIGDARKMFKKGFWPKGVRVREWFDEKPNEKERYFDSSDEADERKSR